MNSFSLSQLSRSSQVRGSKILSFLLGLVFLSTSLGSVSSPLSWAEPASGQVPVTTFSDLTGRSTTESVETPPAGATGISSCHGLKNIKNHLGESYKLTRDIDCSSITNFDPIGNSSNKFTGSLYGQGYTISNLTIKRSSQSNVGLFGYTSGAHITDVGLVNVNIVGSGTTGGLVGYNNSSITNSYVTGSVVGKGYYVGGLVGYNTDSSSITNSYATSTVTGNSSQVGGLVGTNDSSTITNSYATGRVEGKGYYVGGLVGYNTNSSSITDSHATGTTVGDSSQVGGLVGTNDSSTITNSYATGSVGGKGYDVGGLVGYNTSSSSITDSYATGVTVGDNSQVGGLVGRNDSSSGIKSSYATGSVEGKGNDVGGLVGYNNSSITNSYATGAVRGDSGQFGGLVGYNDGSSSIEYSYAIGSVQGEGNYVGGFVGVNESSSITSSYYDTNTTGQSTGVGNNNDDSGVSGESDEAMKEQSTFVGWDFENTWSIDQGCDYPRLQWQKQRQATNPCEVKKEAKNVVRDVEKQLNDQPSGSSQSGTNTVNLVSGDVAFPVSLASLPGRNGLNFDLNLFYTSNVKNIVDTWNLEAPTGEVGLGWAMWKDKIVRNTNGTGTFEDDDFYLLDSGGLNRFDQIHCKDARPHKICYETVQYQPWHIEYDSLAEQWTIITEDGLKHTYGGGVSTGGDGNKTSTGSSIEWGVNWGNWLGSSIQANKQTQYAASWNLAAIENTWGEQLTFAYQQEQKWVGPVGKQRRKYTQSSRLTKITDPTGHHIALDYKDKLPNEYQDPHTVLNHNTAEPDAYQERYGTHYLDKVEIYNGVEQLYTAHLDYEGKDNSNLKPFLGDGKFIKRLLTGISYTTPDGGKSAPPQRFSYWGQEATDGVTGVTQDGEGSWQYDLFDDKSGALYGALKTSTLPQGGEITYFYNQQDIPKAQRKLTIKKPTGNWTNPRLFWGADYVVVTWQRQGQIHLTVYQWVGYWQSWRPDVHPSGLFATNRPADVKIEVQADFFALATSRGVYLFHKNMLIPGAWEREYKHISLDLDNLQVASGERFFVLLDETTGEINRFTWDGRRFKHYSFALPDQCDQCDQYDVFGLTARNNYFFTASASSQNTLDPELILYHLSSQGAWQESNTNVTSEFFTSKPLPGKSTYFYDNSITLTPGNTFVTLQAFAVASAGYYGRDTNVQTNYIFYWSENFEINPSLEELPSLMGSESSTVLTTDGNNLVTLASQSKKEKYTYRFDGMTWLPHEFTNDSTVNNFWGYDSITTTKDGKAQYREFNPDTKSWQDKFPQYKDGNPTLFQKIWSVASDVEMVASMVLSEVPVVGEILIVADLVFFVGDMTVPLPAHGSSLSGVGRYFTGHNETYYLLPSGSWQELGPLVKEYQHYRPSHITGDVIYISDQKLDNQSTRNASDFLSYVIDQRVVHAHGKHGPNSRYHRHLSRIRLLKNGQFFGGALNLPKKESLYHDPSDTSSLIGAGAFISYAPKDPTNPNLKDATELYLYRVADDNITAAPPQPVKDDPSKPGNYESSKELSSPLQDFVVSRVRIHNGFSSTSTHYEYHTENAMMTSNGNNAVYHQVTVIPGGRLEVANRSNGYTEHYYLNGNPDITAGDPTQSPFLNSDTVQQCSFHKDIPTCSDATDKHLAPVRGLEYYTQVCEKSGGGCQEVASTRQKYQVFTVPLDTQQFQGVFTRPWQSSTSVDSTEDNTVTTTYNANGFPVTTTSSTYNLDGTEQTFVTTFTYIQDAYTDDPDKQQLKQLNLLSPVIQTITTVNNTQISEEITTWKNWGSGETPKWAPFQTYIAKNNAPGAFTWSSNTPETLSNWIKTSEITGLDPSHGVVTESQDVDGVYHSVIFDTQNRFPVATFAAARTSTDHAQAGYYGFEAYEDQSTWNTRGIIGEHQVLTHTGKSGLSLTVEIDGSANTFVQPKTFSPTEDDTPYIVSAWVKPLAGKTCGVGFGSTHQVGSSDHATWRYLEMVTMTPDKNQKPLAQCPDGGLIDDFRFGPVAAPFSATVYDPKTLLPTANLGTNGEVFRSVYNQQRQLIATVGPNEQPVRTGTTFFSRQGSAVETNPNASLSITAREGGAYFDFEHEDADAWSGGVVAGGALSLSGTASSTLADQHVQNAAVRLRVMPDPEASNRQIALSVGSATIQYNDYYKSWELMEGGSLKDTESNVDFGQDWLLVTVDRAVLFYVNGQQLFSDHFEQPVSGSNITLSVQGEIHRNHGSHGNHGSPGSPGSSGSTAFDDILIISHPVISVAYSDGFENLLQQQSLENDTTVIAVATLYDQLGRAAIATKPIRSVPTQLDPPQDLLQFQPNLATIDWQSGVMGGSVGDYYPDEQGFPYVRQVFESNPLSRPIATGLPGKNFAYTQPLSSIPDNQNITEYDYDPNSITNSFFETLNIPDDDQNRYHATTQFTPWDSPEHIPQASITNLGGQVVGQQSGSGQTTATAGYGFNFDDSGNTLFTTFPPDYYANSENAVYQSTQTHNVLGELTSQTTPDTHQTRYQYDAAGRLRSLIKINDATKEPNCVLMGATGATEKRSHFLYWEYDSLGRVIEAGCFNPEKTWRQRYHYDDDEKCESAPQACTRFLKGRLFRVSINTDDEDDPEATETYRYGPSGHIRTITATTTEFPNAVHSIGYGYDRLGNVVGINYGANPKVQTGQLVHTAIYVYNQLGQLVSIGTRSEPQRYAAYTYNADGSIKTENRNTGQLTRSYHYNSPGWLTRIEDSYFTEDLTYQRDSQRYDGANIAKTSYTFQNASKFPNGTAPPNYEYDYDYDALGRLSSANASSATDGNIDQYDLGVATPLSYDANGNILNLSRGTKTAPDYTYYDGTNGSGPNQVKTDGSGDTALYCYDADGNMIGSSSDCNTLNDYTQTLSYDPFSLLTTKITETTTNTTVDIRYGLGTKRLVKEVSGDLPTKTLYVHGLSDLPLIERQQSGSDPATNTWYIYGPTGLIASSDGDEDSFYSVDHLGSTRVVSKGSDGSVQAYFNYMPFGGLMEANSGGTDADKFTYRYTGQEYDAETGLYNYRARIYDPDLARFYAADPAQESFGPYTYVGNNPVMFVDPTGSVKIKTLTFNLQNAGRSHLASKDTQGMIREVLSEKPDVAVFTEIHGHVDDAAGIFNALDHDYEFRSIGPFLDPTVTRREQIVFGVRKRNFSIVSSRIVAIPEGAIVGAPPIGIHPPGHPGAPTVGTRARSPAEIVIRDNSSRKRLAIWGVHSPGPTATRRPTFAANLSRQMRHNLPDLVIGDFNREPDGLEWFPGGDYAPANGGPTSKAGRIYDYALYRTGGTRTASREKVWSPHYGKYLSDHKVFQFDYHSIGQ